MEEQQLVQENSEFSIEVITLKEIVNKWLQREHGSDDVDFLKDMGGNDWLKDGLKTDFENGIDSNSVPSREEQFGSNKKKEIEPKGLCQLMWEAFDDLILKILFVAGIASIPISVWSEEDHREIAWLEGFAILIAVFIVVIVTALNDLKKEKEFQELNEKAESGKKVTAIRDGQETDDLKISEVVVGDLIKL